MNVADALLTMSRFGFQRCGGGATRRRDLLLLFLPHDRLGVTLNVWRGEKLVARNYAAWRMWVAQYVYDNLAITHVNGTRVEVLRRPTPTLSGWRYIITGPGFALRRYDDTLASLCAAVFADEMPGEVLLDWIQDHVPASRWSLNR